jgi:5'-3' exonuclease
MAMKLMNNRYVSKLAAKEGYEVFMVTSDKDYGQLVNDKVKIYKPATRAAMLR